MTYEVSLTERKKKPSLKRTIAIWNWFPPSLLNYVRFPRDSSDRHATIPAGPKCTLTLPLMARRCARRQSRRIDGTIFLERWYVRQNRRRHARASRSRRHGVPVRGVLSRGNVRTGNFHATANSIFIYLLDVHNAASYDCCSTRLAEEFVEPDLKCGRSRQLGRHIHSRLLDSSPCNN